MEQINLMTEAFDLTFFGMGFVFLFLTLTVFVIQLMSSIVQKLVPESLPESTSGIHELGIDGLDEETKFVIEEAIKMHREA